MCCNSASGDILNVDVTVLKHGVHGDTSRMFVVCTECCICHLNQLSVGRATAARGCAAGVGDGGGVVAFYRVSDCKYIVRFEHTLYSIYCEI